MSGFAFQSTNNPFGAKTTSSFSLGFNTTTPSASTFGNPNPQLGGQSFGIPTTSQTSTGFSFGSNQGQPQNAFTFGSNTGGIGFGSPATPSTQPTGITGFNTPSNPLPGPGLGFANTATTTQPQTGISFGTPTTVQSGFGSTFGGTNPTAPSFGLTTTTQPSLFGTPTMTGTPTPVLNFGSTTTQPPAGFPLGTPAAAAAATTTSGFGQFTNITSASSLNFQPPVTATTKPLALPFGTLTSTLAPPVTTTQAAMFNLGSTTTQAGSGFNFGGVATSQPGGFNLGTTPSLNFNPPTTTITTTTATTTTTGFSFGFSTPQSTSSFGLGGTTTTTGGLFDFSKSFGTSAITTTTSSVGLGGVDSSISKFGTKGSCISQGDISCAKENPVPNEILQSVTDYKNFVKNQKAVSSEISRFSPKPLHKVQEDTDSLYQLLLSINAGLQKNLISTERLKNDTAKALTNLEIAQRTHDLPLGMQYDNIAPLQYFHEQVIKYSNELQSFREEILNTEKHIMAISQPIEITPSELTLAMQRLHDSFIYLAGKLQTVHSGVETQKEQYLNICHYLGKEAGNLFDKEAEKSSLSATKLLPGPTPFSSLANHRPLGLTSTNMQSPFAHNLSGWPANQNQLSNSSSFLSSHSLNPLSFGQPVENQSFQLQKPPLGNKRGKR